MAAVLEQYVNSVRTLSQQGNFGTLCEFISKSGEVLAKNATHLDNLLATFDIQQHSLGVLGILCVKYNLPSIPDFETLFAQTQEFISSCHGEQVRYATDSYADLCHKFTYSLVERKQADRYSEELQACVEIPDEKYWVCDISLEFFTTDIYILASVEKPLRGIPILTQAISKIQLNPSQLTSIHGDLCQLCLLSKCMKPAMQFLDTDVTEIGKEGGQYDAKHFLLYYYYGGMIYTALKTYDRALYFFEIAVTTPSMAVSHIMLEAYKKYILVSLIVHGKVSTLPKYTSHVVGKYIKPLCAAYNELCSVYTSNNPDEVKAVANKNTDVFNRDSNMGLVKQCITSCYKKNIQRLTKTFLTLSLADMANRVQLNGPKEAEKYVLNMIEEGEIFAHINQRDGMVQFLDNPESYNNVDMLQDLDSEIGKCTKLDEKLREMEREIVVNPQYVQKSSKSQEMDL